MCVSGGNMSEHVLIYHFLKEFFWVYELLFRIWDKWHIYYYLFLGKIIFSSYFNFFLWRCKCMKQAGQSKKQNKNTQRTIDEEKSWSIFERYSQILNEGEKWRLQKISFVFNSRVSTKLQLRNFWKKIQSYGSKDTEKEVNEDLKEEFEIVSETFEKTESEEYR